MQKSENSFLQFRIQMQKMYCGEAYFLRNLKLLYLLVSGKKRLLFTARPTRLLGLANIYKNSKARIC